jgi:hypothetical protein
VILDRFAPASALLRLFPPLARRQVLRWLPRLGLLLRLAAGGRRSGCTGGEILRFRFRSCRSNFGGRVLEEEVWLMCLWREGPPSNWADVGGHTRYAGRRKPGPNLSQGWVEPDTSVRMRRTAGAHAADARVRSDRFKRARTIYVSPLEMPLDPIRGQVITEQI